MKRFLLIWVVVFAAIPLVLLGIKVAVAFLSSHQWVGSVIVLALFSLMIACFIYEECF